MTMIPPAPKRPQIISPDLEADLRAYLKEQREADTAEEVRKLADMFLRQEAEHAKAHIELRGDIRGVSLRVGVLEDKTREHGIELDESQRWIIKDLEGRAVKAEARVNFLKQHGLAIVASLIAIISTVWHLFR